MQHGALAGLHLFLQALGFDRRQKPVDAGARLDAAYATGGIFMRLDDVSFLGAVEHHLDRRNHAVDGVGVVTFLQLQLDELFELNLFHLMKLPFAKGGDEVVLDQLPLIDIRPFGRLRMGQVSVADVIPERGHIRTAVPFGHDIIALQQLLRQFERLELGILERHGRLAPERDRTRLSRRISEPKTEAFAGCPSVDIKTPN